MIIGMISDIHVDVNEAYNIQEELCKLIKDKKSSEEIKKAMKIIEI